MNLKPFQSEALRLLETPGHVICIAPTGSGKSLIYERFAQSQKRTLIVSPLIALARQQAERLTSIGLSVHSSPGNPGSGPPPRQSTVWIASPETLATQRTRASIREFAPQLLVVDECHCLWDWGEEFRPEFTLLPELVRTHSISRSLWLTATLPIEAHRDLMMLLPKPTRSLGEFDVAPQLAISFEKVAWPQRIEALQRILLARHSSPGLVFTATREASERIARLLDAMGLRAASYHAGLSAEERMATESAFASGRIRILVATSAFGMGMDLSRLEWVVLWQAPSSPLALAQMMGRVGRSHPGEAFVLWDDEDFRLIEWMARKSARKTSELVAVRKVLSGSLCRIEGLKSYFSNGRNSSQRNTTCQRCDFCLKKYL